MASSETLSRSHDALTEAAETIDDDFQYRPISTGAIVAALFGLMSMTTFLAGAESLSYCLALSPIPVVGLVAGLRSLAKIRSMPDQLSGRSVALVGSILSAIGLFGGLGYAGYVYATEVPAGYQRTSFYEFRPDLIDQRRGRVVPPDVEKLDGERVFIKGFMRPGTHVSQTGTPVRNNVSRFLLVRDNNQCCFGDISTVKPYDKLFVKLDGSLTTDFSGGIFRVGGKLMIVPENARRPGGLPIYFLEADYIR